jgi:hypothetical protein
LVFGFCSPACVVMLIVVLFRLELYTGALYRTDGSSDGTCAFAHPWLPRAAQGRLLDDWGSGRRHYMTREYVKACSVHRSALESWGSELHRWQAHVVQLLRGPDRPRVRVVNSATPAMFEIQSEPGRGLD